MVFGSSRPGALFPGSRQGTTVCASGRSCYAFPELLSSKFPELLSSKFPELLSSKFQMMRDALRTGFEWTQQSARLMRTLAPAGFLCDWQELDNKIESFRLFQYADRELKLPEGHPPANQILSRPAPGERFHSIWVTEGAGHMAGLASSVAVKGLLTDGDAAFIPETSLVPLHAGMGTAFAEKLFQGLTPNPSRSEIDSTVRRFVDTCAANCRPGWEDATMEPLGLVVRCLYPNLLGPVSAAMEALDHRLRVLFWHGVGRGLYFVPSNFAPLSGARKRMMRSAMEETTNFEDRRNVLAGLVWAVTLVNLCHPDIARSLMEICQELKLRDEFTNGVISALMAWRHMAPEDSQYTEAYVRPRLDGDGLVWNQWVTAPCREALDDIFPGLKLRNKIPALYTYRTQGELARLTIGDRNPGECAA